MSSILVVDDELSMREFLRILLEKEGYQVTVAADGTNALQLAQDQPFDPDDFRYSHARHERAGITGTDKRASARHRRDHDHRLRLTR